MSAYDDALARIKALIYPRVAATEAETSALSAAAQAQQAYEALLPAGTGSFSSSNDGVSLAVSGRSGISPTALAYLKNAGLLKSALPTAKPV